MNIESAIDDRSQDPPGNALSRGCAILLAFSLLAAPAAHAIEGRVVTEIVHGVGLEGTVTGESPDRSVVVYLPPSYGAAPKKRYPVVYMLHGIGATGEEFVKDPGEWNSIQDLMNKGVAAGLLQEMIIVMPNQHTHRFGSFYTNSSVTGRWEDFTTQELVTYIDKKYRTIAKATSRGITGHSMGGYGALKLGMKNPDVYSVAYGTSPALPGWAGDISILSPAYSVAAKAKSYDDIPPPGLAAGAVTFAQAVSPNPNNPPFFVDLPFAEVNGKMVPSEPGFSKWEANFLHNMVPRYREQLSRLRGFRFDEGFNDEFQFIPPNSRALSQVLTTHGVDHVFEEYNGDHGNRMWGPMGRYYTEVLPYFSRLLDPDSQKH